MPKKKTPSERAYARLTKHERQAIERMLDRGQGCREVAREVGRAPSTVANEAGRHRLATSPRALRGEPAPAAGELAAARPRPASWPRCRNGRSKRRGYGCPRRPKVLCDARTARRAADAELSDARRGIDETEATAAAEIAAIRDGPRRGLSPEQIAATRPELGLAASTTYRWADAGHDGMTNMEPRRKASYGPGRKSAPAGAGRRSARGSHAAFGALPGVSLDRPTRAGAAPVMPRVDSEPRGGPARRSPAEMLAAALGEDARALMDAFGVELLEPAGLDLTPGRVERARADGGEAPPAE